MEREAIKKKLKKAPSYEHWKRIGINDHHGICLPLFSLHSEKSSGIGEFFDLLPLIDWVRELSMDVIQLLPINETGKDPSPYNALSSCALDPIYLSLHALPLLDKNPNLQRRLIDFHIYKKVKHVAYKQVRKDKQRFLWDYFLFAFPSFEKDPTYQTFIKQNQSWLKEYALFRSLKEDYNHQHWQKWPKELQNPTEKKLETLYEAHRETIDFFSFLQFLSYKQMHHVKEYAEKKGVFIKGDIPILVSLDSVDVWAQRKIFDLSHIAGCPPDMLNPYGQKWGFPIFNWEYQKKEGYSWWKRRLTVASSIYHIYRIDHVVGFFRIWAILPHETGAQGKFLPKDPDKWLQLGTENLLMLLEASPMLPIAEDLGVIPEKVYTTLKKLGICGTKIMRWQTVKKNTYKRGFIPIDMYEPISLTSVSTHDSETLEQWWVDRPEVSYIYAMSHNNKYRPKLSKKMRKEILYDSHHTSSLFHINLLPEYLRYFRGLTHKIPEEERINIPGRVLASNWTYRLAVPIETIVQHKKLFSFIQSLLP